MKNKILGLDISTRTIGIGLLDQDKKLLDLKHISPRPKPKPDNKLEELFKKSDIVKEFLLYNYKNKDISKVIIEEPLLNSNNIFTCNILIRFNGMISRIIFDIFDIIPEFISSYDSRKYAFPELMQSRKIKKNGELIKKPGNPVLFGGYDYDVDKKMIIWEKVSELYPEITWIYNKNNILSKESFDMSDSVCAVQGFMKKNNFW